MNMDSFPENVCPECGGDMIEGYVTSNHSIRWARSKSEGSQFGIMAEGLTKIGWYSNPHVPAVRCKKCRLVIFRY